MTDKFDNSLHTYFQYNKTEIVDNEFTDKVITNLPESGHKWILYIAYTLGIIVLIISGSGKFLLNQTYTFLLNSADLHVPSLVSCVSFLSIGIFIWLLAKISLEESIV